MGATRNFTDQSAYTQGAGSLEEDNILDLTSSQLHSLVDVELPAHLVELDFTANRLKELDERIQQLLSLKKLSLRQNLFEDAALDVLIRWPALHGLEELLLRDNRLTSVPPLGALNSLLVFDVSFNKLASMQGISKVTTKLRELYFTNNELEKIQELDHLQELAVLELGSNKIREMEGLGKLMNLKELWLGRNRIRSVDLHGLKGLTKVSLQSNRLTSMLGFQECVTLEELYLSHNLITEMEGAASLVNLRILDISSNKIQTIKGLDNLNKLEDLWLNDNIIPTLDGIEHDLAGIRSTLTAIYLERNPCASDSEYRKKLKGCLPNLVQIDSTFLG